MQATPDRKHEEARTAIDADAQAFLDGGGRVTVVPNGASSYSFGGSVSRKQVRISHSHMATPIRRRKG